jgi:RNA polymerase sigma factor (sigma-70 family)
LSASGSQRELTPAERRRFTQLYGAHRDSLLERAFLCLSTTRTIDLAEGVVQDVAIKFLSGRYPPLRDLPCALPQVMSWVRGVARNRARFEARRIGISPDHPGRIPPSKETYRDPCFDRLRALRLTEVWDVALASLTAAEAQVFMRRFRDGCSVGEIAGERGCSASTVRELLARAKRKARRDLQCELRNP